MTTIEHTRRYKTVALLARGTGSLPKAESAPSGTGVVSNSMRTGPWLNGPAGRAACGGLGVFVDHVLGQALMLRSPAGHVSVSSEISIDVCGPVPSDGSLLSADGRVLRSDALGAFATGSVVDDTGRLVAVCSQHGRWVGEAPAGAASGTGAVAPDARPNAENLLELIGARVKAAPDGAELYLDVTEELVNPLNNLHGGIGLCASDIAAHAALETVGKPSDTASVHIAYVRPVPLGTRARFDASMVHSGRSFAVVRVTAVNEAGKPCTIATVTTATPK
ncbi:PaaI family thioesterase [Streptomyces sp. NPDC102360]|uniref:PaaI family thioesterase n=1 Tax=Streptomyces sp. NPDC102360 TaxID=3366160 RepID=UPI0037F472BB